MAAVVGLEIDAVEALCGTAARRDEVLVVALHNGPGHAVVSGSTAAVERLLQSARDAGARRASRLATSNAFHSPLMAPAREAWERTLGSVELRRPSIPVALNATGELAAGAEAIRSGLAAQLVAPVLWQRCVERLVQEGARGFVECGDAKVLTALHRSISPVLPIAPARDPWRVVALAGRPRRNRPSGSGSTSQRVLPVRWPA